MKALLSGCTGYIGRNLGLHLSRRGFTVYGMSRKSGVSLPGFSEIFTIDYSQPETLARAWALAKPDFALHLASELVTGRDFTRLATEFNGTVMPALQFAATVPAETKLCLFWGSCEEYGDSIPPFREDIGQRCFSPYGWGKISAYHATAAIARARGLSWSWIRPFLTFGPGQNNSLFIPTIIRGCREGKKIALTRGEQTRDFLYIDDLCLMVERILQKSSLAREQIFNLCSGEPRKLRAVAEEIQKLVGKGELDFGALPYRSNEAMSFFGSNEKFLATFGPMAFTPFSEALKTTANHFPEG